MDQQENFEQLEDLYQFLGQNAIQQIIQSTLSSEEIHEYSQSFCDLENSHSNEQPSSQSQYQNLKRDLEEMKYLCQGQNSKILSLETENSQINDQLFKLKFQNPDAQFWKNNCQRKDLKIQELETENSQLNFQLRQLKFQYPVNKSWKNKCQRKDSKIEELETENSQLSDQLLKLKIMSVEFQYEEKQSKRKDSKIEELETENSQLSDQLLKLKIMSIELQYEKKQSKRKDSKIEELETENSQFSNQLVQLISLKKSLEKKDSKIELLREKLSQAKKLLSEKNSQFTKECSTQQLKIKTLQTEKSQLYDFLITLLTGGMMQQKQVLLETKIQQDKSQDHKKEILLSNLDDQQLDRMQSIHK